jgi:hypothetical protein
MEDLFEALTRSTGKSRKFSSRKLRRKEETLAESTLSEALGGAAYGDRDVDRAWLDLDHAIAASSARSRIGGYADIQDEFDSSMRFDESEKFESDEEHENPDPLDGDES